MTSENVKMELKDFGGLDNTLRLMLKDSRMRYEVEVPLEIEQRLAVKASATGQNVTQLIQAAIVQFVDNIEASDLPSVWTPELENRRRHLIDCDIRGEITQEEQSELQHLDRLANTHFDAVAPPPIEAAQRLHSRLLKSSAPAD